MSAAFEAGFVFWGLFVSIALLVAGYLAWMIRTERNERRPGSHHLSADLADAPDHPWNGPGGRFPLGVRPPPEKGPEGGRR